jgi:hypothetical protein
MTLSRALTRFGLVAAAAALMLTLGLAAAGSASAQVLPAVLYGKGLTAGQVVAASIGGKSCGSATVNAAGEWTMQIATDNSCGPTANAAISFTVDGKPATASPAATWASGGTPSDIANGYKLTVTQATPTATATATATTTATATATSTPGAVVTATPAPPKTGNAGLLGSDGGNGGIWLLLGFAAVAGAAVAGRQLYGRRDG